MKVIYENKIGKKLENESSIKKNFGKLAVKIIIRLSLLFAASCLDDVPNIPPTRRHKLIGNYRNCWGIEIEKNWRIVVRPNSADCDNLKDIKEITIVDIVDYH